ncbi:MAG: T9SS type A sorting domain-containing protein [Stygiobacter sp.]
MKNRFYFLVVLSFIFSIQVSAQLFKRTAEITEPSKKERGFGGVIAGVDFDKDGKTEIYACNTNMVDGPYELIPRLYKFEWNKTTSKWDSVWSATAPLSKQNTWPAFAWGDVDKDGKPEIYWAPVNYSPYPELPRILVYEYSGTGDDMGVSDGLGGFLPNASTPIVPGNGINLRPIKFVIADVDNDGKDEIIFGDRNGYMKIGVLSVDKIPDLGGGTEKWTVKFAGTDDPGIKALSSVYDIAVVNNYIYAFDGGGNVAGVYYANGKWNSAKAQKGLAGGKGSFKGSAVVDINKDGKKEILVAEWLDNTKGQGAKVWLLQQVADSLTSTEIADLESLGAVRLNGAAAGDLDGDGKLDFVTAARYDANNTVKVPVFRVEYQSGDIASKGSYTSAVIDSAYWTKNGDMDVVALANVDGDKDDEVLYTQGYSRGNPTDERMPLVILDRQFTPVSVEKLSYEVPANFYLEQNYPNPFNPTTNIRFGLNEASIVQLKVYNLLGEEVTTLVNNELMNAGSYNIKFNAEKLSSGIYIYTFKAGNYTLSKKMQLIK